jgi:hypothetical protein
MSGLFDVGHGSISERGWGRWRYRPRSGSARVRWNFVGHRLEVYHDVRSIVNHFIH